jgi:acyl-coenzyme A thioesterase PaaI-like protein
MANPTQQFLESKKKQEHPACIGCSIENASGLGLGLEFVVRDDGGVQAEFACSRIYQGYPGYLHGGISSLLLDSAMANCIFAHQKSGVTARLIVKFFLPVAIDKPAVVKAWMREYEPPLYVLESEIEQNGKTLVKASAKFIDRDLV